MESEPGIEQGSRSRNPPTERHRTGMGRALDKRTRKRKLVDGSKQPDHGSFSKFAPIQVRRTVDATASCFGRHIYRTARNAEREFDDPTGSRHRILVTSSLCRPKRTLYEVNIVFEFWIYSMYMRRHDRVGVCYFTWCRGRTTGRRNWHRHSRCCLLGAGATVRQRF